MVAKPSGNKNKNTFSSSDSGFSDHLVAIYSIQTLALAAALALATSTRLWSQNQIVTVLRFIKIECPSCNKIHFDQHKRRHTAKSKMDRYFCTECKEYVAFGTKTELSKHKVIFT